jgi:solute carrier family 25 protein 39/40
MDHLIPKEQFLKCFCKKNCTTTSMTNTSTTARSTSIRMTFKMMFQIARQESPMSLYSGLPPTLLIAVPSTALYFSLYEFLFTKSKQFFPEKDTSMLAMYSGCSARGTTAFLFSPIELIRVRMQAAPILDGRSFRDFMRQAMGNGIRSLFVGLQATLARDIPFSAIYWYGIETTKQKLEPFLGKDKRITVALVGGTVAGTIATICTHPFDVLKTRAQSAMYSNMKTSEFAIARQMWCQEGGSSSFLAGMAPRLLKVTPACAIMLTSYEAGKVFFDID